MEGIGTILARYPGMISEILYSKITDTIGESQIQGEKGNILVDMISEPSRITLKLRNQKEQVFRLTTVSYTHLAAEQEAYDFIRETLRKERI